MKSRHLLILILTVMLAINIASIRVSLATFVQATVTQQDQFMQKKLKEHQLEYLPTIAPVANRIELPQSLARDVERLNSLGRKTASFARRSLFVAKPDQLNSFERLVSEMATFTLGKDNPTFFRFFQNVEQPNQLVLFEEWQDLASFERHLAAPHTQKFLNQVVNLTEKAVQICLYRYASEPSEGDGVLDRSLVESQAPAKPTAAKTRERLEQYGMANAQFVLFVDVPIKNGGAAIMKDTAIRVQKATLQEPNSIRYGYYQDLETPTSFLLFEWWRDFAAMEQHVRLSHFQELMKTFAAVGGDGRTVGVYRPLPF